MLYGLNNSLNNKYIKNTFNSAKNQTKNAIDLTKDIKQWQNASTAIEKAQSAMNIAMKFIGKNS